MAPLFVFVFVFVFVFFGVSEALRNPGTGVASMEALTCGTSSHQQFVYNATTKQLLEVGSGYCVTVDSCNMANDSNVILTECFDQYSAPCNYTNQQWEIQQSPWSSTPGEYIIVSVHSLPELMCLEIPFGGPTVDIYDCESSYPSPILHEIWTYNPSTLQFEALTDQCLTAIYPIEIGPIWPMPQEYQAQGSPLLISSAFVFTSNSTSQRLAASMERYSSFLNRSSSSGSETLAACQIVVRFPDESLTDATSYNYTLTVDGPSLCTIAADSVYGAMYGMESFMQLLSNNAEAESNNSLIASSIIVNDWPRFSHRGLMIDTGRRFFPLPLVYNLLDTMSYNKLNILHLHASDYCRFSIESLKYPELTANLTGLQAGFYSQEDIAAMLDYASYLGIRIIPEFDMPGHSGGFAPLSSVGVDFCSNNPMIQLYNDPNNSTFDIISAVLTEMSGLFPDSVLNIGCDETSVNGPCSLANIASFESEMVAHINSMGKTPMGWEEILFDTQAASPNTIVNAWSHYSSGQVTAAGYKSVESNGGHFYLNHAPTPYTACWWDIAPGFTPQQNALMLGGEISMWSDNYCYTEECQGGPPPVAAVLYNPEYDAEFSQSIGGMVWPRGHVAAGSFWNYQAAVDVTSPEFLSVWYARNDDYIRRGSWACPSNCTCDELTSCGQPYLPSL